MTTEKFSICKLDTLSSNSQILRNHPCVDEQYCKAISDASFVGHRLYVSTLCAQGQDIDQLQRILIINEYSEREEQLPQTKI